MKLNASQLLSLTAIAPLAALVAPASAQTTRDVQVVLQVGDPVPGTGSTASAVNAPATGPDGTVGFSGTLASGGRFVWAGAGIVFWSGQVVTPSIVNIDDSVGLGAGGRFAFSPSVTDAAGSNDDSLWTNLGAALRERDAAPGLPGKFLRFSSRIAMFGDDGLSLICGLATTPGGANVGRVVYKATIGPTSVSYTPVLQTGDVVSGPALPGGGPITVLGPGVEFVYDISDNGLHHIQRLGLNLGTGATNVEFLWKDGSLILREGTQVAGSQYTENWENFSLMSINNNGDYLVAGDTTFGTGNDAFLMYNGRISMRESEPPLANGIYLLTPASVNAVSINNTGCAAVIWTYLDSTSPFFPTTKSLFFGRADDMYHANVVLQIGDELRINGAGAPTARVRGLSAQSSVGPGLDLADDGRIAVQVQIENLDGTNPRDAIIIVSAPCEAPCVADFDDGSGTGTRDGGVGIEDLLYYLSIYDSGIIAADVDDGSGTGTRDGGVGIEDLLYYLVRYDAGC